MWTRRPRGLANSRGVGVVVLVAFATGMLATPVSASTATTPAAPRAAVAPGDPATPGTSAEAGTRPIPSAQPEPRIITNFARDLTGERKKVSKTPQPPVRVRANIDGCDRNYGEADQCIPSTLPTGRRDYCKYLAEQGFERVTVRGSDTKRLDHNRNGVACD